MKEVEKMNELKTGMKNEVQSIADESKLAVNVGSGTLRVLSTPSVAVLMEKAAFEMVQPSLPEGITTVGTMISIEHISATPFNGVFRAAAVLTDISDRKYCFELEAYDEAGLIAKGRHERVSVKSERFVEKAENKLL